MDAFALRLWAERYNHKLEGALEQYLIGNRPLEECLAEVVTDLHPKRDLTDVVAMLEAKVRELDPELESPPIVEFLEKIQDILEEKGHVKKGTDKPTGILSDRDIRDLALNQGMITPFVDSQVTKAEKSLAISYGLSSCGYDVRVGNTFRVFTNTYGAVIDPKNFDPQNFTEVEAKDGFIILPPNGFAVGLSVEKFNIPRDIVVLCEGKSTYARCGVVCFLTPLEPEWEGYATLNFCNGTPNPAKVYANEGVAQFLFQRTTTPCEVSYKDRGGKYQGTTSITTPRMKD